MEESTNAFASVYSPGVEYTVRNRTVEASGSAIAPPACCIDSVAEDQIRGLVRHLFLPGWPSPARQVVFSPVDESADATPICLQVGQILSAQVSGTVCVWEADGSGSSAQSRRDLDLVYGTSAANNLRECSRQMSSNLWHVSRSAFSAECDEGFSERWVRRRLEEVSLEFDYAVIRGPAAGSHSEAALLGHLCDGIVLIVEANATRRMAALKVKDKLRLAKARLLGAVLTRRTFPIPEALYKRL